MPFLLTNCSSDSDILTDTNEAKELTTELDQEIDSRARRYKCPRKTITNLIELADELEKIANCRQNELECDQGQKETIKHVIFPYEIAAYCSTQANPCTDCAPPMPSTYDVAFQDNIISQAQAYANSFNMPCNAANTQVTYHFFADCTTCTCGTYCNGSQVTANCTISVTFTIKCCSNLLPDNIYG